LPQEDENSKQRSGDDESSEDNAETTDDELGSSDLSGKEATQINAGQSTSAKTGLKTANTSPAPSRETPEEDENLSQHSEDDENSEDTATDDDEFEGSTDLLRKEVTHIDAGQSTAAETGLKTANTSPPPSRETLKEDENLSQLSDFSEDSATSDAGITTESTTADTWPEPSHQEDENSKDHDDAIIPNDGDGIRSTESSSSDYDVDSSDYLDYLSGNDVGSHDNSTSERNPESSNYTVEGMVDFENSINDKPLNGAFWLETIVEETTSDESEERKTLEGIEETMIEPMMTEMFEESMTPEDIEEMTIGPMTTEFSDGDWNGIRETSEEQFSKNQDQNVSPIEDGGKIVVSNSNSNVVRDAQL